jgi:hypothetical protein
VPGSRARSARRRRRSAEAFREAAELAQAHGPPEQLARAALGYGGRISWEVSRDDEYLVPLLESALKAIGDEDNVWRVRLLARLAGGPLRDASFPPEKRAALSAEALESARRIGDPATLAYALCGYISSHHSPEFTPMQVDLATEVVEVATEREGPGARRPRAGDLPRPRDGLSCRADRRTSLGGARGPAWI